ncbi:carboxypeptidase B-like [Saccostrea echinata]|uniref:carboxypeptidase B-like n=1 Tax=Saccostrea echinata TaxID=191078 RepID=UPI002A802E43|nr:carboxypeptidase B-like [Saccostrea echinata]
MSLIAVVFLFFAHVSAEPMRFDGHKVLQILPHSVEELEHVLQLHDVLDLDMWRYPSKNNFSMEMYVEPEKIDHVLTAIKAIGADVRIWIDDLQKLIDEEKQPAKRSFHLPFASQGKNAGFDHLAYHRFSTIKQYLADVVTATQAMSTVTSSLSTIGYSSESNEIQVLKVSRSDGQSRPSIFIDGGIHAREWISPATVLYFINQLVYGDEFDYAPQLLDKFDWYFAPVLNPDGYEYSHTTYRLWRKNRVPNGRNCFGTDLNRNFGYQWNPSVGGSTNVCSDVYSGATAFSEKESTALETFLLNNNQNMVAYLTYHSYGQMWLYPWGYTSALPSDWQDLDAAAKIGTSALSELYGTQYTVGSSTNVLYSAAGGSDDWAKGGAGVKYSYTIELRDTGAHGFVLPQNQIEPNCRESWRGLAAFALSLNTRKG